MHQMHPSRSPSYGLGRARLGLTAHPLARSSSSPPPSSSLLYGKRSVTARRRTPAWPAARCLRISSTAAAGRGPARRHWSRLSLLLWTSGLVGIGVVCRCCCCRGGVGRRGLGVLHFCEPVCRGRVARGYEQIDDVADDSSTCRASDGFDQCLAATTDSQSSPRLLTGACSQEHAHRSRGRLTGAGARRRANEAPVPVC